MVTGPAGPPATALWAVVAGDGSLIRGSGVTTTAALNIGRYEVTFNRDVTTCALVAGLGLGDSISVPAPGSIGTNGRAGNANAAFVITYDAAGTTVNAAFHLAVFCP